METVEMEVESSSLSLSEEELKRKREGMELKLSSEEEELKMMQKKPKVASDSDSDLDSDLHYLDSSSEDDSYKIEYDNLYPHSPLQSPERITEEERNRVVEREYCSHDWDAAVYRFSYDYYKRLFIRQIDDTVEMYQRLEKEKKRPPTDLPIFPTHYFETLKDGTYHRHSHVRDLYQYYFHVESDRPFPWYLRLRMHRNKENGERFYPYVSGWHGPDGELSNKLLWDVDKSQEYIKLFDELCSLKQEKVNRESMSVELDVVSEVASNAGLNQLRRDDKILCESEATRARKREMLIQQLDLYHHLKEKTKGINDENLKNEFPLVDDKFFVKMKSFFSPEEKGEISEEESRSEMRMLERRLEVYISYIENASSLSKYYKQKNEKALEIGIIQECQGLLVHHELLSGD